ncbi:MAG: type II toxin-antitoxin system VapC family toxin [Polaromonas sp.]|uniref:type II toxin-antitoxin system VapC family toxin n=1 Tax=Polaromonas sp. TaxID=1869339 RepID=UPI00273511F3|nr:type II toxin-antitoxin system VapC family toxin [Polaromonas sp.]MDP2820336.1 type II toxin-antitoxin system VapC family toxin [Polaromonas sp.]
MMYLLDTNVVSELRKIRLGKADLQVAAWADSVEAADLYLSAITLQELEIGVLLAERRDPTQGAIFRAWLNGHVLPAFDGRVLSVDTAVAQRSARLHVPDPRPVRDGLIAATALVHGMTVVTRNVADFEPTGAKILNPWVSQSAA